MKGSKNTMNEKLLAAGSFIYKNYLKPAPKVAFKAVLGSWIGTTAGLVVAKIILLYKNREILD